LARKRPGEAVVLKVMRGDKELELKAILEARPESRKGDKADEAALNPPSVIRHDVWLTANELGGPLVDLGGKVVGVNIAISGRTQNYALTAEAMAPVLKELLAGKWAPSADDLDLLRSR
jgi:serine protease Do